MDTFLWRRRDRSMSPVGDLLSYIPSPLRCCIGFQSVLRRQRDRCYLLLTISNTRCCRCGRFASGLDRRASSPRLVFGQDDVSLSLLLWWIRLLLLLVRSFPQVLPWWAMEVTVCSSLIKAESTIFWSPDRIPPGENENSEGKVTQEHHHKSHSWSLYTISILVQMAASLNQELQELILRSLDANASIADTSKLVLPSHPSSPVDQQVAQAVLTSLASRYVL